MDANTIFYGVLVCTISIIINFLHWRYMNIKDLIKQVVDESKNQSIIEKESVKDKDLTESKEPIAKVTETDNDILKYIATLGQDAFVENLVVNIDKVPFEEIGTTIKSMSQSDLEKMGPKEAYMLFIKMLRYDRFYFEKVYNLKELNPTGKLHFIVTCKTTDLVKMSAALWKIIEPFQKYIKEDMEETVGKAMGMFTEIMKSGMLIDQISMITGNMADVSKVVSGVLIEEVTVGTAGPAGVLTLTDKDRSILDEINQIENDVGVPTVPVPTVPTVTDDSSEEVTKTDLEKKMEAAGLL